MGVGRYLRTQKPGIQIHPMEPLESPTMSTGHKVGHHRIQGISDEFVPAIVKLDTLADIVQVSDGDSILMAQKLSQQLGLGLGISSGGNFLAALKVQNRLGPDAVVVTVFSDDNKKYLSTDLMRDEPEKPGYLSGEVELINYEAHRRLAAIPPAAG
jgi:cysteine synthase A